MFPRAPQAPTLAAWCALLLALALCAQPADATPQLAINTGLLAGLLGGLLMGISLFVAFFTYYYIRGAYDTPETATEETEQ